MRKILAEQAIELPSSMTCLVQRPLLGRGSSAGWQDPLGKIWWRNAPRRCQVGRRQPCAWIPVLFGIRSTVFRRLSGSRCMPGDSRKAERNQLGMDRNGLQSSASLSCELQQ
jgi:hypothetical protein